jgi:hypothetical protein
MTALSLADAARCQPTAPPYVACPSEHSDRRLRFYCTLQAGHGGVHVAHGSAGAYGVWPRPILAAWDDLGAYALFHPPLAPEDPR